MSWSTSGTAATYPTAQPAKNAAMSSLSLTFRADPDSGIVYVTGSVGFGATMPGGSLLAAPLDASFRPLAAASLPAFPSSGSTGSLTVNPDGTLTATTAAAGTGYSVRAFYFTDTTPA